MPTQSEWLSAHPFSSPTRLALEGLYNANGTEHIQVDHPLQEVPPVQVLYSHQQADRQIAKCSMLPKTRIFLLELATQLGEGLLEVLPRLAEVLLKEALQAPSTGVGNHPRAQIAFDLGAVPEYLEQEDGRQLYPSQQLRDEQHYP